MRIFLALEFMPEEEKERERCVCGKIAMVFNPFYFVTNDVHNLHSSVGLYVMHEGPSVARLHKMTKRECKSMQRIFCPLNWLPLAASKPFSLFVLTLIFLLLLSSSDDILQLIAA